MTKEVEFILQIWESVKENVDKASKQEALANDIIQAFLDYGIEYNDIATLEDEDATLGRVLMELIDPEELEEDEFD